MSSEPLKVGRVIPLTRMASAMAGPWFHMAAATEIRGPYWLRKSRFGTPPSRPAELVTDDTLLLSEEPLSDLEVARRIEVVEGVEKGDQVAGFSRIEVRVEDSKFTHLRSHAGKVVPHGCGERIKRPRTRDAAKIGPHLAAHPVHCVTPGASLQPEDARTGDRVLCRAENRLCEGRFEGPEEQESKGYAEEDHR